MSSSGDNPPNKNTAPEPRSGRTKTPSIKLRDSEVPKQEKETGTKRGPGSGSAGGSAPHKKHGAQKKSWVPIVDGVFVPGLAPALLPGEEGIELASFNLPDRNEDHLKEQRRLVR